MSGIAGLHNTDGAPVDKTILCRLIDSQSHRGPDGKGVQCGASVAFGHLAMHTTPEAAHETQPLVGLEGNLMLSADARIDNRSELISELGLEHSGKSPVTDADLILRSYRRWGKTCPEHLRGAFAFAIWDAHRCCLFCARDRMGLRPFHYFWSEPHFVFGSEINALLTHPAVSSRINDTRVADFLVRIHLSNEYTFYENIFRLPPGHYAIINREGLYSDAYWTLTLPEERTLNSEEAYAEAFWDVFSNAVEDRLRTNGPVGSFLSGGLDSSSVTTMARELSASDIHTFSAVYDETPEVDESEYIQTVLNQSGYQSHFVAGNACDLLKEFPDYLASQQKATLAHTPSLMQMLHRKVHDVGLNVALDGHGGDEVTSRGHGYPEQLAHQRRWMTLLRELRGRSQNARLSWPSAFLVYWLRYGSLPDRIGQRLLHIFHAMMGDDRAAPPRLIGENLARRTKIKDREQQYRKEAPSTAVTERQHHFRQVNHTIQPEALEELNQLASAHSIEPRFPFWDPRVVEFCLSLPSSVKRQQGVGRQILRAGLASILPDQVRTRTEKAEFRQSVVHALTQSDSDVQTAVGEVVDALAPYVDLNTVHSTVERFVRDPFHADPADIVAILQILRLGYFLKNPY